MNAWTRRRRADAEADALLSGGGAPTSLLEVEPLFDELRARYADRPAPAPSAALEQVFAWGLREEESRPTPAAAWLPARTRDRVPMWTGRRRAVVAVLAATLVLAGLAVAGAVPAVQDAIADAAKQFGIDLPRSAPAPKQPPEPSRRVAGNAKDPGDASNAVRPSTPGAGPAPSVGVPGTPSASALDGTSPTSLPPGGSGIDIEAPPITVPPIDVPPITIPPDLPIDLPPIDLPPVTVPPIDLPPIV